MSRSEPPRSPIVAKIRQSPSPDSHPPHHGHSLRRRIALKVASVSRWLHIYLSMFGLAVTLFFGATGLTLNHPDWFGAEARRDDRNEGQLDRAWLHPANRVAKLEIVEHLRKAHRTHGAVTDFRIDDQECVVMFKGPGYAADAIIDRETGRYTLSQTAFGVVAVINDLHKGRDTGAGWSVLIDISAVLLTLIALTGLVLLFYLKRRRRKGLVVALVGLVVVVVIYILWVP
jgi:hypothetical protein